ncbi:uncharacterized protein LOC130725358 [Lotus japonicus]|uniref:uncharacterized protein LOC130725358 n=1 Tax=Lotus japonicus TaxID=34305 RepID=UPI00258A0139|nr:uncharacterized protein LOC130725358 [Lotus japonicus]
MAGASHLTRNVEEVGPEETLIVFFEDKDVAEALAGYENYLAGRLVIDKPIYKGSLQSAIDNIWCSPDKFQVEEVRVTTYVFHLKEDKDIKHILQGSPWIFQNSCYLVQPWNRHIGCVDMSFKNSTVWVQLWGLPAHCRTKKMSMKVGAHIGKVLDVDIF